MESNQMNARRFPPGKWLAALGLALTLGAAAASHARAEGAQYFPLQSYRVGPYAAGGSGFGDFLLDGLNRLEGLTDASDSLAVKATTGDLQSIHDYTIAAAETSTATQLTVAVRNKAIDAFNEIMRMQA